jgi:hypothetical protein
MALQHVSGLDHVVILVRDLDGAALRWRELGFTLSPRGLHSAAKGTANHTMMLGSDYLELLGLVAETPMNAGDRAALERLGEGLDRAAVRTDDAAAGLEEIRRAGFAGSGPQSFERPVDLPGGGRARAAFRTFEWPADFAPAGLRLFACEHLTPETVWVPALQRHPNGATAIKRLEMLSADPDREAALLGRMLAATPAPDPDGGIRVPTGDGRADLVLLNPGQFGRRHPGTPPESCRPGGAAALVLSVEDLDRAARVVTGAERAGDAVRVRPERANGVLLVFEPA